MISIFSLLTRALQRPDERKYGQQGSRCLPRIRHVFVFPDMQCFIMDQEGHVIPGYSHWILPICLLGLLALTMKPGWICGIERP